MWHRLVKTAQTHASLATLLLATACAVPESPTVSDVNPSAMTGPTPGEAQFPAPHLQPVPPAVTRSLTSRPDPSVTAVPNSSKTLAGDDVQMEKVVGFVVSQLAGGGPKDRVIVRIESESENPAAPLQVSPDAVQECWLYRGGVLSNCVPQTFFDARKSETTTPWKSSYVVFQVTSVGKEYERATVRYDETFGPASSTGYLLELAQVEGGWRVQSRRVVWVT